MKLKSIHWILIAIIFIEVIAIGVWFGVKHANDTDVMQQELPLHYDANEDGTFSLLSLLSNVEEPNIQFKYDNKEYDYSNISLVQLVDAYSSFEKYQTMEPLATQELWAEFKNQLSGVVNKKANQEHAVLGYIRNVAKTGCNVPHEQLYNNLGIYSINTTTTLNNWHTIFEPYIIKDEQGNTPTELAIGATIRIDDIDYNAIVYTMVQSDANAQNNSTAQEVSVHILFGDHIIPDITNSEATIYYLKPDGSAYFAHSSIKVTYMATGNEARYRDLLSLGGLQ